MRIDERQDHSVPADYDLTCWYLNARRVIELVGAGGLLPQIGQIDTLVQVDDATRKSMALAILKQSLTVWMHGANVPTLGQLLVQVNCYRLRNAKPHLWVGVSEALSGVAIATEIVMSSCNSGIGDDLVRRSLSLFLSRSLLKR